MSEISRAQRVHELDVTVWVGKHGIESVSEELDRQLGNRDLVKVKFHRSARAGTETDELAAELAGMVDASIVETRGHTAVVTHD